MLFSFAQKACAVISDLSGPVSSTDRLLATVKLLKIWMTKKWWQKCQLRPHKLQQLTLSCGKPHRIMMRHLPKCPTSKLQPNWTIQVLMADLWLNVDDIPCLWFLLAWSELPLPESRSIFFDLQNSFEAPLRISRTHLQVSTWSALSWYFDHEN